MEYAFKIHTQTRKNIAGLIKSLPETELLRIPAKHRNNLLWNVGHVVVVQQLLCYRSLGLPIAVDEIFVNSFKKDSSPAGWQTTPDIKFVKEKLIATADKFGEDYRAGLFRNRSKFPTKLKMVYGITLATLEEAILFNNTHEAMHLGIMMSLKKHVVGNA